MPYSSTVLEHFRRPRNRRQLARPSAAHEAFNALCGDRVRVELEVAGGVVVDAAFTASACAICTAAASLLTERLAGNAARLDLVPEDELIAALDASLPPSRRRCATLPLEAARAALASLRTIP